MSDEIWTAGAQPSSRIGRASSLIGKPVLTLDSGTIVGELKDVLTDLQTASVVGFSVRGRGLLSSPHVGVLGGPDVAAIGRDALMIETADALTADNGGELLATQDQVIGKEAVSSDGRSLGEVTDVVIEIDGDRARVVGYELSDGHGRRLVPLTEPVAVSGTALVVPEAAQAGGTDGLDAFGAALRGRHS